MIRDVTDRDFPREVEQASTPVLVEFWQPGCGHCLALLKQLEQLQEEVAPVVKIVKMNVQENFQIPAALDISSLPALARRFESFVRLPQAPMFPRNIPATSGVSAEPNHPGFSSPSPMRLPRHRGA